jgi:dehydrogenase/reductase SDR family member 12
MSWGRKFINGILDSTVVYSFDQRGYKRHMQTAPKDPFRPGENLKAIVTGATRGIGLASVRQLLALNVDVIFCGRVKETGVKVLEELKRDFPERRVDFLKVDMGDLKDVLSFCREFPKDSIDILIHNAGGLPHERILSPQGVESVFASQVLGPFCMTRFLIDNGILREKGRIVFISSGGMYLHKLSVDDLNFDKRKYNGYNAYANAKRSQLIITDFFSKAHKGKDYLYSCMHPGWVDTEGVQVAMPGFHNYFKKNLRNIDEGADTISWLAMREQEYKNGAFWFDRKEAPAYKFFWTKSKKGDDDKLIKLCDDYYNSLFI